MVLLEDDRKQNSDLREQATENRLQEKGNWLKGEVNSVKDCWLSTHPCPSLTSERGESGKDDRKQKAGFREKVEGRSVTS